MSAEQQAPEIIREAVSELRALSADERARQLAEDRFRAIVDQRLEATAQYDAGKAEGRAEGEQQRARAVARRLLTRGAAVADITGLSEAEVRELAQSSGSETADPPDSVPD